MRRTRRLLIGFGWAMVLAIVYLSLTPAPPDIDLSEGDKLGHFLAYGTLMFWFGQLYRGAGERVAYAAGFIALGLALEGLQALLGYRTYDTFDLVANTLGVLMGWAAARATPSFVPAAEKEGR